MRHKQIHILCTRDLEQPLIDYAAVHDVIIKTVSFIHTEPIQTDALRIEIEKLAEHTINGVFTSTKAVKSVGSYIGDKLPRWNIYCLAGATKATVEIDFPNSQISASANNAQELALEIINKNLNEVIFFCGDKRRDELPTILAKQKIEVMELVVYKTTQQPFAINSDFDAILFFSPSAVESFFVNNSVNATTILFAIGNTTAETIKHYASNKIITSKFPGKSELIDQVIIHFNTINQN